MDFVLIDSGQTPLHQHFLFSKFSIRIRFIDDSKITVENELIFNSKEYRWSVPATISQFELRIEGSFVERNRDFPLIRIIQKFSSTVDAGQITGVNPISWTKLSVEQNVTIVKTSPALHPLLRADANTKAKFTLEVLFVDITKLFFDIHSDTPWFSALRLTQGTNRVIRVLALLKGHPLIWYVAIPTSVFDLPTAKPVVLYYPADYGGIYYANSIAGVKSSAHNTSTSDPNNNIQCGAETLGSFLNNPVSDLLYERTLSAFVSMRERHRKRPGRNPPPLHHYRDVLNFKATANTLTPLYWTIPFGFEEALTNNKAILLVPQLNGGDGAHAIKAGLKSLVDSALGTIYTHGFTLTNTTFAASRPSLVCFSESGGNVFTAAHNNPGDIAGIVCFEPQYMNEHLRSENTALILGKTVIPKLLDVGCKVAIVGRHKGGWEGKYLPDGVSTSRLSVLPDDAHYGLLDYPEPTRKYDPNAFPVLVKRYSRLLSSKNDAITKELLSGDFGTLDTESAVAEEKVESVIDDYRKQKMTDEQIVKKIFTSNYNADTSGGYFTHNLIIASGQQFVIGSDSIRKFFHDALDAIK